MPEHVSVRQRRSAFRLATGAASVLLCLGSAALPAGAAAREPFPPPTYTQAVQSFEAGDFRDAAALFLSLATADPTEGRYTDRYARCMIQARDLPGGIAALERLTAEAPDATAPHHALALLQERAGRAELARLRLRRAIQRGTTDAPTFADYCRLDRGTGRPPEAAALLDSLTAANGESAPLLYARGVMALLDRRMEDADHALSEAIETDPDYLPAYVALGGVAHQSQQTVRGISVWADGLARAVAQEDAERQLEFLEARGDLGMNSREASGIPAYEDALALARRLGETTRAARIRSGLVVLERDAGHVGRAIHWAEEDVAWLSAKGDSLEAAQRLAFLGGILAEENDGWSAVGALERSLAWSVHLKRSTFRVATAQRLARTRLVLGDLQGAERDAGAAIEEAERYVGSLPTARSDLWRSRNVLGHVALFRGDLARAESLYHATADEPLGTSRSPFEAEAQTEAWFALARLARGRGDAVAARAAIEKIRTAAKGPRDSLYQGLADLEELELLANDVERAVGAEGTTQAQALADRARGIATQPGRVSPKLARSAALLVAARGVMPHAPDEALTLMLDAWIEAESVVEPRRVSELPESFLPDPAAPVERLAVYFARLALVPEDAAAWRFTSRVDSSHAPRDPAGLLAARWSWFFANRRRLFCYENALTMGPDPALPLRARAARRPLWMQVKDRVLLHAAALRRGELPKKAPRFNEPLLADLVDPARRAGLESDPGYRSCPWLVAPAETSELAPILGKSGETIAQTTCAEELTLLYLLQGDRLRIAPVFVPRDSLAAQVRTWVPYYEKGCATANLSELGDDFEVAGKLYNALLAPIGESADLSRTIWIVPEGPLAALPFESLAPRGGRARGADSLAVLDRVRRLPLAVDRHRIAYLLDPSAVLTARTPDANYDPIAVRLIGSGAVDPHRLLPPLECLELAGDCTPAAESIRTFRDGLGVAAVDLALGEAEMNDLPRSHADLFTAATIYRTGEPWCGGLRLEGEDRPESNGFWRWTEVAKGPRADLVAYLASPAARLEVASPALRASQWGLELTIAPLAADLRGASAVYQTLWNSGESAWIPLVRAIGEEGRPDLAAYLDERARLRHVSLPAGPGHSLCLAHPYFSCSMRWWQLSRP